MTLDPSWVAAIGTIILAIVAVFQDRIRRWVMRPKLKVAVRVAPPDCHKTSFRVGLSAVSRVAVEVTPGKPTKAIPCYYFRIGIKNEGNTEAREVEVFAASLQRRRMDGNWETVETFTPMNLLWSHFRKPFLSLLSPKMPKVCDLAHVIHPDHRRFLGHELKDVPEGKVVLAFDLQVEPNTKGHLVGPGTYRLRVVLAASNATPKEYILEIKFPGIWLDDESRMLRDGFGMKLV